MGRKIVITSGKGGVGKTTVCANLGYMLAKNNLRVLLVDADVGLNNLDLVLGIENKVVYDLVDIINGKCRPMQALVQDLFVHNLYILPSNHMYYNLDIEGEKFRQILTQLDDYFDYILIDCPAGIESGFFRAVKSANEAIVVTTSHLSAIRDSDKVINILQSFDILVSGIIVNRVRGDLILSKEMLNIEDVSKYLRTEIIGVLPEDDNISFQLLSGSELKNKSESFRALSCVADKLHHGEGKIYDCTKKYKGIIGYLKRNIRRWV